MTLKGRIVTLPRHICLPGNNFDVVGVSRIKKISLVGAFTALHIAVFVRLGGDN